MLSRRRKVLLDKTATWIQFVPIRSGCREFYTTRLIELSEHTEFLYEAETLRETRREIEKVCNALEACAEFFDRRVALRRSPESFREFISRPAPHSSSQLHTQMLASVDILICSYTAQDESGADRYHSLKEGIQDFRAAAVASRIYDHNIISIPGDTAATSSRLQQPNQHKLISAFLDRCQSKIGKEINSQMIRIDKESECLMNMAVAHCNVAPLEAIGSMSQRISDRAIALRSASLKPKSASLQIDLLPALAMWAHQLDYEAKCVDFLRALQAELSRTDQGHRASVLPLILGSIKTWCGTPHEFLPHSQIPDGLFSFDRRLGFHQSQRMRKHDSIYGVECRGEFKLPLADAMVEVTVPSSVVHSAMVKERSLNGHGFSIIRNTVELAPFSLIPSAQCPKAGIKGPYVMLGFDHDGDYRFRSLSDVEDNPIEAIANEFLVSQQPAPVLAETPL